MCSFSVFFLKSDRIDWWLLANIGDFSNFPLSWMFVMYVCEYFTSNFKLHLRVQETLTFFVWFSFADRITLTLLPFFFSNDINVRWCDRDHIKKLLVFLSRNFPKAEELISPLVKVVLGQSSRQNRFQMDASLSLDPGFLLAKRWVKDQLVGGPLERSLSTKK